MKHTTHGGRHDKEPRLIGDIIREYLLLSNEPLAVAYRKRMGTAAGHNNNEKKGEDHGKN